MSATFTNSLGSAITLTEMKVTFTLSNINATNTYYDNVGNDWFSLCKDPPG